MTVQANGTGTPPFRSLRTVSCRVAIFAIISLVALKVLIMTTDMHSTHDSSKIRGLRRQSCPLPKRILVWTTYWTEQSFGWEKIFYRQVSRQCETSTCELVYDHRLLDSADAVLFHPIDLHPEYVLPARRDPRQLWIFFSVEAPPAMVDDQHVNLTRLGGVFNWTMTYRLDSDVVVPYGRVSPKPSDNVTLTSKDYWSSKDPSKVAAWMVSHCGTPGRREWFVKELVRHMKVDVFGRCGHKKCGKNISIKTLGSFDQDKCNAEIGQYMFYFALENAICQDYVSEKFFLALQLDVIPVVFGGGNYAAIAPPRSYINALDFPSPKALADYLKVVASNATLYNKYLEWKDHYNVELGHPFSTMVCDLCAKLHDPRSYELPRVNRSSAEAAGVVLSVQGRDSNGSYPDIESWFVKGSACRRWWAGPYDRREHWNL
ncbi:alpha-(1,3)-fucosyltransferase C-like [Penaeus japonicus]|uniref:alpha-(1,3)-fucosyltransferase C-like n=1 Tax=Penaeus japonicus TaxID=27405 RepID=UPI001C70E1AE|nr:alpha-(1,3)-fucosyltransferase C-like [Penaeus japonicus]